jgi:hypothetical protein
MPTIEKFEDSDSSGLFSVLKLSSPIFKAIDALRLDPKLKQIDAAKMFYIDRKSIYNRLRGKTRNRNETSYDR